MSQYHISGMKNPWKEYRIEVRIGEELKIDSLKELDLYSLLSEFDTGDGPLLAHNAKSQLIVFNAKIFEKLSITDATNVQGIQVVGSLTQKGLSSLSLSRLAEFLIQAEIIKTYIHIEAFLTLKTEIENESEYRADYEGSHVYYTNKRNEVRLGFSIEINKLTGKITLLPRRN